MVVNEGGCRWVRGRVEDGGGGWKMVGEGGNGEDVEGKN